MVENNNEGRGKYKPNSSEPYSAPSELNDFYLLLSKEFTPTPDRAKESVEEAVKTLAECALAQSNLISDDAVKSIEAIIAVIDKRLSDQVNQIMHFPDFQKLEGSWQGLHYMVCHIHTDDELKIKILNISKKELAKILKKYKGPPWQDSPIFKMIYEEAYAQIGGEPFCCIVGDYYFNYSPPDHELLHGIAQIAASANAPFITGASPALLGLETWQRINNCEQISRLLQKPEYASWRCLRESAYSRYLCLTLPRFLARPPYGCRGLPVEEFYFEEDIHEGDHSYFTWSNSSFALATNICVAYEHFGWPIHIQGMELGGAVLDLPIYVFPTDDRGVDVVCPTETGISDSRVKELTNNGLTPLVHDKKSAVSYFLDVRTLHKAPEYDDIAWNINAELETRLPFVLATARFVHYLKVIVRQKMNGWRQPSDIEEWFNAWINDYVETEINSEIEPDPKEESIQKPLASAHVKVDEIPEKPGYYNAKFFFRPHYRLNGFIVSLRVHCLLPMDEIRENYL